MSMVGPNPNIDPRPGNSTPQGQGSGSIDRLTRAEARRQSLENQFNTWREFFLNIAKYTLPMQTQYLRGGERDYNKGAHWNTKIINDRATQSALVYMAGMQSGVTSPSRPWFKLGVRDLESVGMSERGRSWLYRLEQLLYSVFSGSNLYATTPQAYLEHAVFGTAGLGMDPDRDQVLRAVQYPIGSYFLGNGPDRKVNTVYRRFGMSAAQLAKRFGADKIPSQAKSAVTQGTGDSSWYDVVHYIEPNADFEPDSLHPSRMKFRSAWYLKGHTELGFLSESGMSEMRALFPRWFIYGEDAYGSLCPGQVVHGRNQALQLKEKRKISAYDRAIKPPLQAPASMRHAGISLLPGALNYLDFAGGGQKIEPIGRFESFLADLHNDIDRDEDRIGRAFFEDLFLMLQFADKNQLTATEVVERHDEKLIMLGPALERVIDDLLDPMIGVAINILAEDFRFADFFADMPPELAGRDLRVEYVSILAQAQQAVGLKAIERYWSFAGALEQIKPGAVMKGDADATLDEFATRLGIPPHLNRPTEVVNEEREQAAREEARAREAEVAATEAAAGKSAADAASVVSQIPTEGGAADNALDIVGAV